MLSVERKARRLIRYLERQPGIEHVRHMVEHSLDFTLDADVWRTANSILRASASPLRLRFRWISDYETGDVELWIRLARPARRRALTSCR